MKKPKTFTILIKNNKGSVILFILVAILFFLITSLSVFFFSDNIKTVQIKQVDKIQNGYNPKTEEINEEYKKIVEGN